MDVRRRNRVVVVTQAAVALVFLAVLLLLMWQVDRRRTGRVVACLIVAVVMLAATASWRLRDLPDTPIPILPLARTREELIAGIVFLVLLVGVFASYWLGWIG